MAVVGHGLSFAAFADLLRKTYHDFPRIDKLHHAGNETVRALGNT